MGWAPLPPRPDEMPLPRHSCTAASFRALPRRQLSNTSETSRPPTAGTASTFSSRPLAGRCRRCAGGWGRAGVPATRPSPRRRTSTNASAARRWVGGRGGRAGARPGPDPCMPEALRLPVEAGRHRALPLPYQRTPCRPVPCNPPTHPPFQLKGVLLGMWGDYGLRPQHSTFLQHALTTRNNFGGTCGARWRAAGTACSLKGLREWLQRRSTALIGDRQPSTQAATTRAWGRARWRGRSLPSSRAQAAALWFPPLSSEPRSRGVLQLLFVGLLR